MRVFESEISPNNNEKKKGPTQFSSQETYVLAGFKDQLLILLWKTCVIIKRKKFATVLEIFLGIFFISMLLIIRYFVEKVFIPDQLSPIYNVIDYFQVQSGKNLVLYSPDTPLIKRIVTNAFDIIKLRKNWLNFSS